MPIHLDSHTPDVDLTSGTTKSDIVAFLYDNPGLGYSPAEVSEELDIPSGTATTTLGRLEADGYVGKTPDSYYHALEDREDLRRYVSSLDQLDRLFDDRETEQSESDADSLSGEPADDARDRRAEEQLSELKAEIDRSNE